MEEVKDLGNVWCAHVELCALGDVRLCLKLGPQGLVAVKFDEGSFDGHAASVAIFPPVITLADCARADDSVLKAARPTGAGVIEGCLG